MSTFYKCLTISSLPNVFSPNGGKKMTGFLVHCFFKEAVNFRGKWLRSFSTQLAGGQLQCQPQQAQNPLTPDFGSVKNSYCDSSLNCSALISETYFILDFGERCKKLLRASHLSFRSIFAASCCLNI